MESAKYGEPSLRRPQLSETVAFSSEERIFNRDRAKEYSICNGVDAKTQTYHRQRRANEGGIWKSTDDVTAPIQDTNINKMVHDRSSSAGLIDPIQQVLNANPSIATESLLSDWLNQTLRICLNPAAPISERRFTTKQAYIDTGATGVNGWISAETYADLKSKDFSAHLTPGTLSVMFGNSSEEVVQEGTVPLTFRINGERDLFESVPLHVAPKNWNLKYDIQLGGPFIIQHRAYFLDLWYRQTNNSAQQETNPEASAPPPALHQAWTKLLRQTPSCEQVRQVLGYFKQKLRLAKSHAVQEYHRWRQKQT